VRQLELSGAVRKLKRLGDMSAQEIAYRLRERTQSELERFKVEPEGVAFGNGIPFHSYLQHRPASRFYPGISGRTRQFVQSEFPEWIDRAVNEAEELCRHRLELLGLGTFDLGPDIDWHRDPVTGETWPLCFWADYNLEQECAAGDPKVVCELNRHQHLPRLAKTYFLTGDERYASEAVSQMESWIDQNPPGLGVHWQSSLEIALRSLSWLWTMFFLARSPSWGKAADRLGSSLFSQIEHVCRYPSVFSSPNTHLLGEAAVLFIAGLIFEDLPQASRWLRKGSRLLIEHLEQQVLEDGVYGELSSYYHCYALDFYLQAFALAERNSFRLPEAVPRKVSRMLDFLLHLSWAGGRLPLLGDDDGGRALALERRNYGSIADELCTGAVLFRRPDCKFRAGPFAEETLWLLGAQAWCTYTGLPAEPPPSKYAFFPHAGYLIQRSGWHSEAAELVFDCGSLGLGAGGHAHADALSISLASGGHPLLIDPGTFVYNGAPGWRAYFRSTSAHNTVTIDGQDQAEPAGTFRWNAPFLCRPMRHMALPGLHYAEAEHEGYCRNGASLVHRRRLLHVRPAYWIVADEFCGSGAHRFDFHYHFAPDLTPGLACGDGVRVHVSPSATHAGLRFALYGSAPFFPVWLNGLRNPAAGWMSNTYGDKRPSPTLRASMLAPAPAAALWVVAPSAGGRAAQDWSFRRLDLRSPQSLGIASRHGRYEDVAIVSYSESAFEAAGLRLQGGFFWLQFQDSHLRQILGIQARLAQREGHSIFESTTPANFLAEVATGLHGNCHVRDLRDFEF
jgi:hypothetical protein